MGKKLRISWFQYLGIGSFVAGWLARACADGKITREEIEELITGVLDMLGLEEISVE